MNKSTQVTSFICYSRRDNKWMRIDRTEDNEKQMFDIACWYDVPPNMPTIVVSRGQEELLRVLNGYRTMQEGYEAVVGKQVTAPTDNYKPNEDVGDEQ
jgi:hypothetical protein